MLAKIQNSMNSLRYLMENSPSENKSKINELKMLSTQDLNEDLLHKIRKILEKFMLTKKFENFDYATYGLNFFDEIKKNKIIHYCLTQIMLEKRFAICDLNLFMWLMLLCDNKKKILSTTDLLDEIEKINKPIDLTIYLQLIQILPTILHWERKKPILDRLKNKWWNCDLNELIFIMQETGDNDKLALKYFKEIDKRNYLPYGYGKLLQYVTSYQKYSCAKTLIDYMCKKTDNIRGDLYFFQYMRHIDDGVNLICYYFDQIKNLHEVNINPHLYYNLILKIPITNRFAPVFRYIDLLSHKKINFDTNTEKIINLLSRNDKIILLKRNRNLINYIHI